MHMHRDDILQLDWHMPGRTDEKALEKPNVYNNGSLKNSRCHWSALVGVGIRWPGRKLVEKPLKEAEAKLVNTPHSKGVMLSGARTGQQG